MSWLKTSLFNFAFGSVAHAGAPRGQWQSSGRHQRQTAEPQLPQQCHGIIIQASLGKFILIVYLPLHVAAEPVYWNPLHTSTPCIAKSWFGVRGEQGPLSSYPDPGPDLSAKEELFSELVGPALLSQASLEVHSSQPLPVGQRVSQEFAVRRLLFYTLLCS